MFRASLNRLSLSVIALFLSSQTYAQLSSCTPNYSIESDTIAGVSQLWMTITFDDITDLGGVEIAVYNLETGSFFTELILSRQDLIDKGYLTTTGVTFPTIGIVNPEQQYRFDINPYNLSGGYINHTELITTL